jgi:hypothetical protein
MHAEMSWKQSLEDREGDGRIILRCFLGTCGEEVRQLGRTQEHVASFDLGRF